MHTSVRTFCPSALGFASAIAGHRVVVMPAPQSAALEGRAYHLGCGISWLGCVSRWDQLPVFVSQSLTTHIQWGDRCPWTLGRINWGHTCNIQPSTFKHSGFSDCFCTKSRNSQGLNLPFQGNPFQMEFDCFTYLPSWWWHGRNAHQFTSVCFSSVYLKMHPMTFHCIFYSNDICSFQSSIPNNV